MAITKNCAQYGFGIVSSFRPKDNSGCTCCELNAISVLTVSMSHIEAIVIDTICFNSYYNIDNEQNLIFWNVSLCKFNIYNTAEPW